MTQTELKQKHQELKKNKQTLVRDVIYVVVGNIVGVWLIGGIEAFAMKKTWVILFFLLGLCLQLFLAYRVFTNHNANKKNQIAMIVCSIIATAFVLIFYLKIG
ncbi:hypothetical protein [Runella salmonicolor]|uniref:Uncharacterized protein n=1 Tax=Runella salmonicolor TaxID=2950278 RepID=A0ABT1FN43_9BACT|nr:hypothetical protein [Runella salmonicolor]MCP1383152.1 hypothetical protein [Runella salmonicolor]